MFFHLFDFFYCSFFLSQNESLVLQIANKLITLFETPTNQSLSALYEDSNIKITLYNIQQSFDPESIEANTDYSSPVIQYINTTLTYLFNMELEIMSDIEKNIVKFNLENIIAVSKYKVLTLNGLNDNSYVLMQPIISLENEVYSSLKNIIVLKNYSKIIL